MVAVPAVFSSTSYTLGSGGVPIGQTEFAINNPVLFNNWVRVRVTRTDSTTGTTLLVAPGQYSVNITDTTNELGNVVLIASAINPTLKEGDVLTIDIYPVYGLKAALPDSGVINRGQLGLLLNRLAGQIVGLHDILEHHVPGGTDVGSLKDRVVALEADVIKLQGEMLEVEGKLVELTADKVTDLLALLGTVVTLRTDLDALKVVVGLRLWVARERQGLLRRLMTTLGT